MIQVVVGSMSEIKVRSVKEALDSLGVEATLSCLAAPSSVNAQPLNEETVTGALARAGFVQRKAGMDCYAVGIENGLFHSGARAFYEKAVIVIFRPEGSPFIGSTASVQFPYEFAYGAIQKGCKVTAGSLIAAKLGGDPDDPHATLTKGRISRRELLVQGLRIGFAQILP